MDDRCSESVIVILLNSDGFGPSCACLSELEAALDEAGALPSFAGMASMSNPRLYSISQ